MSEKLLSNDKRVQKQSTTTGIRIIDPPIYNHLHYRPSSLALTTDMLQPILY